MTEDANARTRKHWSAFLGAPVGGAIITWLIWNLFSERCGFIGTTSIPDTCVPVGGVEFSLGDVTLAVTILTLIAIVVIELWPSSE